MIPEGSRLQTFPEVEQGTDAWHDQRRGMITASAIGSLITAKTRAPANNLESRGLLALLAAERITGWTDPTYVSDDMLRGKEDEPYARDAYAEHNGTPVAELGFMVRSWGHCQVGYSPDGLVGDLGLIEIKSPRAKRQLQTVLAGEVPAEHVAQCQTALFVSGRRWIDYVSYTGGMHLWTARVLPDPSWFAAIAAAVEVAEAVIADMVTRYREATAGLPMTERRIEQEMYL